MIAHLWDKTSFMRISLEDLGCFWVSRRECWIKKFHGSGWSLVESFKRFLIYFHCRPFRLVIDGLCVILSVMLVLLSWRILERQQEEDESLFFDHLIDDERTTSSFRERTHLVLLFWVCCHRRVVIVHITLLCSLSVSLFVFDSLKSACEPKDVPFNLCHHHPLSRVCTLFVCHEWFSAFFRDWLDPRTASIHGWDDPLVFAALYSPRMLVWIFWTRNDSDESFPSLRSVTLTFLHSLYTLGSSSKN